MEGTETIRNIEVNDHGGESNWLVNIEFSIKNERYTKLPTVPEEQSS
jgi:hypothetical protein